MPSIGPIPDADESSIQQSPDRESHLLEPSVLDYNPDPSLDRNASIASNQTIPRSLFRDFDGVHVSPQIDEDIEEEDEEEEDMQEQLVEQIPEVEDALKIGSEYEAWFQEQWQQAEGHCEPEVSLGAIHEPTGATTDGSETKLPQEWVEPPPPEGMQYYPAPVPRELNMPKRLSRQLPPEVMAKRRSQVLGAVNPEARKSAVWLAGNEDLTLDGLSNAKEVVGSAPGHKRDKSSLAKLKNLPPQLRASIFFDHEPVPHDIEMKGESATATLENLLNASVDGPPPADMNPRHPDAVGKHRTRASTASLLENGGRASRASMLSTPLTEKRSDGRLSRASMLSGKRSGSFDNLGQAGNRSSAALSLSRFSFEGKRNSSALEVDPPNLRIVNGSDSAGQGELEDDQGDGARPPQYDQDDEARSEGDVIHVEGGPAEEDENELEDDAEPAAQDSDEYDEAVHGPPTTLLAELQLRKQKLKSRNRTAVSAFPNGMHSTLLEMDAVAQIEKRRRHKKPTTLAWEDPSAKGALPDIDDEDVPLGVLFPTHRGLIAKGRNEWDQPLGLLARREQEENEPLSSRRNRLRGVSPWRAYQLQQEQLMQNQSPTSPHSGNADDNEARGAGSDHEGETLAQRTRRLRSRRALDEAIASGREGAQSRALSDDFASEMMSTFGPLNGVDDAKDKQQEQPQHEDKDTEHEGETLGQRRKRLQAEAAAREMPGDGNEPMVSLQPSRSMANLLAQAPQTAFGVRNVSDESRASGLLREQEDKRAREKQHLMDQNYRSGSGMGIEQPLVGVKTQRLATEEQLNRGGAGNRTSFAPGQFSGLRSASSNDLLRDPATATQTQQPHNAWAGTHQPPRTAFPVNTMSNFSHAAHPPAPFPHLPGNQMIPNFATDPKGGARYDANRGSMLWKNEQSKRAMMLSRQWTDGNFGTNKTYAAHAMGQTQPNFEQMTPAMMDDLQRAKIEQWRTSILP